MVAWPVYLGNFVIPLTASFAIVLGMLGRPLSNHLASGYDRWPLAALAVVIGIIFFSEMQRYERPGGTIVQVALRSFYGLLSRRADEFLGAIAFARR